jgi:uncharacterized protein (DUF1015 family)
VLITYVIAFNEKEPKMADIRPFPALRPNPELVEKVASPPYDVLNSDEARAMASDNPHSFLHVVKAEIDLPVDADVHGQNVYQLSADNLNKMVTEGTLIQDEVPCFYIYELTMDGDSQRGIAAGVSAQEYEDGLIKKHEFTRREKEDDRAKHVEILQANAGPVLLTYRNTEKVSALINNICDNTDPVYDFTADDGIGHKVWVVADEDDINGISEAFGEIPATYVADGHHRSASGYRVRNLMRDANPAHTGNEPYNHYLAVLFPDNELKIMGYNRVVKDLNGLTAAELLEKAAEKFEVAEGPAAPESAHQFGMFLDSKWYRLTAKDGSFPADDPVEGLDVAILQSNLLTPLLGIGDPRTDNRIDFVGGIRGTDELERRCGLDAAVAFSCYPVSVEQLMTIADADAIMPPKSTWFEPKLRSGVVVRSLKG